MLEQVHAHITDELQQGARTDTVFVVTAIVFNLLVLGINSAVAGAAADPYRNQASMASDIVLVVLTALLVMVNAIAVVGLLTGWQTRNNLLNGLLAMYRDNDVDRYYDGTILLNYNRRYLLFCGVILCLALTAIAVPWIVRFL